MSKFLQNLNSNMLCAIDTETTGSDPRKNDIIQIAIIPLNIDLKPSQENLPFICEMKPKRPENVDPKAMATNRMKICELVTRGMCPYGAADRFVEWFDQLKLLPNRRIMPLACNWPFDRSFILEWLGPQTYDLCFDARYRDVMTVATFVNDRAGWMGNDFPYPKVNLQYLCTQMRIERDRSHDAVDDARVTAEVYRRLVQEYI